MAILVTSKHLTEYDSHNATTLIRYPSPGWDRRFTLRLSEAPTSF